MTNTHIANAVRCAVFMDTRWYCRTCVRTRRQTADCDCWVMITDGDGYHRDTRAETATRVRNWRMSDCVTRQP